MNHDCGGAQSCCGSGKVLPFWVVSGFCRTRASGATGATHEGFFMKYTIEGFDQEKMVEAGLDCTDAELLRWFVDFISSGRMKSKCIEGQSYYWVLYAHVIEDLPLCRIRDKTALSRRFMKLVSAGFLVHRFVTDGGSYSYFGAGKGFVGLISSGPSGRKSGPPPAETPDPLRLKVQTKDPSSNDPSTNDQEEGGQTETVPTRPVSDLFSKLYSENCGGARPTFGVRYVGPIQQLLKRHGLDPVLLVVRGYFAQDWWFTKDKSSGRKTWSYSGLLNHFDEVQSGLRQRPAAETEYLRANGEAAERLMGRSG